jgi:hypothetical protein
VQTVLEFERRARAGERNANFVFRDGAARVVFWGTDEPGTNDDNRSITAERALLARSRACSRSPPWPRRTRTPTRTPRAR